MRRGFMGSGIQPNKRFVDDNPSRARSGARPADSRILNADRQCYLSPSVGKPALGMKSLWHRRQLLFSTTALT
jgi:hypothetical protein